MMMNGGIERFARPSAFGYAARRTIWQGFVREKEPKPE
jgi:hypothetical protein